MQEIQRAFNFAFGVTKPPTLRGLPWRRCRDRSYPALSHGGILYVVVEGFHNDVIGVAYNPKTNAFDPAVLGFKPLADHWYVWTSTDDPMHLTRSMNGHPKAANNALHTNSAPTLGLHMGDHWRGDGEGERWARDVCGAQLSKQAKGLRLKNSRQSDRLDA